MKRNIPRSSDNAQRAQDAARQGINKRYRKSSGMDGTTIALAIFGIVVFIGVIFTFLSPEVPITKMPVIDEEAIGEHNASSSSFRQGPNEFFGGKLIGDAKDLLGDNVSDSAKSLPGCPIDSNEEDIPASFDARAQWPSCVEPVYGEKGCAASYAISLTGQLSERMCVQSGGDTLISLSPKELLACDRNSRGCAGGLLDISAGYLKSTGAHTIECLPFTDVSPDTKPTCSACANGDVYKASSYCILTGEDRIKKEIMKNGPVTTLTYIFNDFLTYKSGVYQPKAGAFKYNSPLALNIVGWGVEGNVEYWLVKNSWGETWGENGYGKIAVNGADLQIGSISLALEPAA